MYVFLSVLKLSYACEGAQQSLHKSISPPTITGGVGWVSFMFLVFIISERNI